MQRPRDTAAESLIDDCVQRANDVRGEYEDAWRENWGNYRVETTDEFPTKQYPLAPGVRSLDVSPINFLKTPESHQGVNTLRALLLGGLFGTRDYVQADPVGNEDVEAAQRVSRLVMFGLERPGNFRTNFETIGDGLIFGLGSYSARWKTTTKLVPRRFPVPDPNGSGDFLRNPDTGSIMTILRDVEVPVYDDPTLETDDLYDTWFDPAANRFDELQYKVKRFRIRDEELKSLQDDPNWDADGIALVLKDPPNDTSKDASGRSDHPKLLTESLASDDVKDIARYGYYCGYVFEGMIDKATAEEIGGISHRGSVVIRIVNGIVIQAIQSPQRNGQIQGGSITILPTGRGIYGLSPLSVVRYLQDVSNTQLILTVQALIESVYQNYLIGGDLGPTFAKSLETRRPREALTLQGDIDQVQPLPRDWTGLQIGTAALQLMSQTIRQAMNARDPVQGTLQQDRTTATEAQLVTSAALQNTDQLAALIERDELPTMGRLINDLYYINLDDDAKVFRRVGESTMTEVSYFDIDAVTDINFVGARMLLSKAGKANQFRDFATMLASNPFTAAATDWHELVRRYGEEGLDLKGLESLMLRDEEEIVSRMQAMGLANLPGQSIGGNGAGGSAPQSKVRRNPANGGGTGGVTASQNAGESS